MTVYYPNSTKVRGEKRRSQATPSFIEERSVKVPECGCWLWTGAFSSGYGSAMFQGKSKRAHRLSWEIFKGPIPDGVCVCHECDTPACVNPDHLFLGTKKDNADDRDLKGRNKSNSMPGESHPLALLTEGDVREIRLSSDTGTALAKRYGVHVMTISCARRRVTWKHVV